DDPSGGCVLHPGIIAAIAQDRCTIEFENSELPIKTGDGCLIHYHEFQEFVQRRIEVEEQSGTGPLSRVVMNFIGDAISSDTRQEYRVSTINAGLTVTLDTDEGCTIQEISMSGLGLISDRKYSIGQILNVTLQSEDEGFGGRAVVEWIQQLDGDRTQYGLRGLFDAKGSDTLRIGLMRFTRAVHRKNLQRISGAA
ncbi:MAG: PilZ domain-containing protein, partial [Myxococcota bacterium]